MAVTGLGTVREELEATSVDALFLRGESEKILKRKKVDVDLEKIIKSERGDHRLRVIACELLIMLDKELPPKIARIYSEAISGAFMHNWWGLPGHHVGRLGETILKFGENALPYLVKEMDDPTLMTYLGPEAPICRERKYCAGDIATYLACLIMGKEYPDSEEPDVREKARLEFRDELAEKLANERRK